MHGEIRSYNLNIIPWKMKLQGNGKNSNKEGTFGRNVRLIQLASDPLSCAKTVSVYPFSGIVILYFNFFFPWIYKWRIRNICSHMMFTHLFLFEQSTITVFYFCKCTLNDDSWFYFARHDQIYIIWLSVHCEPWCKQLKVQKVPQVIQHTLYVWLGSLQFSTSLSWTTLTRDD